ncbi:protein kinase domain-containing protein [Leptospira selangorensis]|nr:protein kinase [Leptospira selangorensis]
MKWASVSEGGLYIEGKNFNVPGYKVIEEIGRGANGIVFKAIDEKLKREVAIKVWNKRGKGRALEETIKIASLDHPLILKTFLFDVINNHPYSVMEYINGQTGKEWLKESQSIARRLEIWKLYSKSLHYIYSKDIIHGDPHLGNVLIFNDVENVYSNSKIQLSIKLADTGTSKFSSSKQKSLTREAMIIAETARRIFEDQKVNLLWCLPDNLSHKKSLSILDNLCQFIYSLNCVIDYDRKSEVSDRIVKIILETPLFNLDEVLAQIREKEFPPLERVVRRLNFQLYDMPDDQFLDSKITIDEESKRLYKIKTKQFIFSLKSK